MHCGTVPQVIGFVQFEVITTFIVQLSVIFLYMLTDLVVITRNTYIVICF